jgi:predicted secreted protein with PEFG-CTERM motif
MVLIVACSISIAYPQTSSGLPIETANLGNVTLSIEIASTPATMEKGLMFHEPLSFNQGMLFVFNPPQVATMWMKNMQFPIDMIWFDSNGNILHIEKSLPPCTGPDSSCTVYDGNSQHTSYVLEVASGFVDHYGIGNLSRFVINSTQQSTTTALPNLRVPEFGPIASFVLAIAIISIIAASKTGLKFIPRY